MLAFLLLAPHFWGSEALKVYFVRGARQGISLSSATDDCRCSAAAELGREGPDLSRRIINRLQEK